MIPLRDQNPTSRPAVVTFLLILVNVAVYFFIQPHNVTSRGGGVQDPADHVTTVSTQGGFPLAGAPPREEFFRPRGKEGARGVFVCYT